MFCFLRHLPCLSCLLMILLLLFCFRFFFFLHESVFAAALGRCVFPLSHQRLSYRCRIRYGRCQMAREDRAVIAKNRNDIVVWKRYLFHFIFLSSLRLSLIKLGVCRGGYLTSGMREMRSASRVMYS